MIHPQVTSLPAISEIEIASGVGWRAVDVVCRCGPDDPPGEERHDRISVAAILAGSFTYEADQGRALMTPGSFLLGNFERCYRCSHHQHSGDRCVAFQCTPEFVEEIAADIPKVTATDFRTHRLAIRPAFLPALARIARMAESGDRGEAEELAVEAVGVALRLSHEGDETRISTRDETRVATALSRMEEDPGSPISLSTLAAEARVGRHHFLRIFRRVTGVTPYAYLTTRRLLAAADALCRDGDQVLDIALATGFSDFSDFTRRFRSVFGSPPAQYRKGNRTN